MKASEWLEGFDSHGIYDAKRIAQDFKKKTGLDPCWPVHSAKEMVGMIEARGLGGDFHGTTPAVSGYEIAEALAETLAKSCTHQSFHGRGSRFRDAMQALKENGM